jgi:hypothetical protein
MAPGPARPLRPAPARSHPPLGTGRAGLAARCRALATVERYAAGTGEHMSQTMYPGVHIHRLTIPGHVYIRAITFSPAARGGWPMRQPVYAS